MILIDREAPDTADSGHVGAGHPTAAAAAVADAFERIHGVPPYGVFAAPGRVNLIGEHTDYNGGLCLPIALPHATYVAARRRPDRRITLRSLQVPEPFTAHLDYLEPTRISGWAAYAAGVVWALDELGVEVPGIDLVIDSRVPVGAGLSSSAALECAVALATCAIAGVEVDDAQRRLLVDVCMRVEQEVAGAPTGGMDQAASLLSRHSRALWLDCRSGETRHVTWELPDVDLLVVDTRVSHSHSDGQYGARRADCARAARELGVTLLRDVEEPVSALPLLADATLRRRARHVFSENARVGAAVSAILDRDAAELGRILVQSHASLRDDYDVSCPELDLVVDTALAAGALGARMTGGGFGGSAIVLVHRAHRPQLEAAVRQAFSRAGLAEPGFLLAQPSAGAREVKYLPAAPAT